MVTKRKAAKRGVCIVHGAGPSAELSKALETRGISSTVAGTLSEAVASGCGPVAFSPARAPTADEASAYAAVCEQAARAGDPVVMLAVFAAVDGSEANDRAAALAYLRSHGAILCADPDVWLECLALLSAYDVPTGSRVAVVAPPGSWLALSAAALAAERAANGTRSPPVHRDAVSVRATDTVLVDRAEISRSTPKQVGDARVIPVVGRAESLVTGSEVALVGLREAIEAATLAGRCGARLQTGFGPAPTSDADAFDADGDRFDRQVAQLGNLAGDHETKVMLKSWGVSITRQAVATTPSAATRIAKKAGWPVEIKPWSAEVPTEPDGCPVESDVYSAPDVRRAFVTVAKDANLESGAPVIVRETPPRGRELRARFERRGALGWTVVVEITGVSRPIAAPAPLREADARDIARCVEASRTGDPEPDHDALVDLLRRASHMVVANQKVIATMDLARVVVAPKGQGAVVVDARATLNE